MRSRYEACTHLCALSTESDIEVSFLNPRWSAFVSQALAQVCQTLGVNFQASQPRAELYKLLLYETGSQYALKNHFLRIYLTLRF